MHPPFDLTRVGAGLPFAASVENLRDAVRGRGVAVVQAPPGTGKTTLAPPALANDADGRVVVVQPRRIAARAAARRLAGLSGGRVGEAAGFTVRGERRVGAATRVEFVTPGILLRRLLADPELPGVAAVVLDEVHERGLETDLLVGMLAEVRELRDELVLVAMSATLDAPRFAALIGGEGPAPVVDCPTALHPLQVGWVPFGGPRTDAHGVSRDFLDHVARVAADARAQAATNLDPATPREGRAGRAGDSSAPRGGPDSRTPGAVPRDITESAGSRTPPPGGDGPPSGVGPGPGSDVAAPGSRGPDSVIGPPSDAAPDALVFVPGVREVEHVARRLRELVPGVEVLELHGRLDARAQDRVTADRAPGEAPRVVVSTSLAESSLTVPGVRVVVDAGLAREPRRDAARGMTGLVTVPASRDAAIQRAGRAARLGPGLAVRCYDETTFAAMPAHVTPEIATGDLVGAALTLACWGSPRGEGLALPDPPPATAIADAEDVLRSLGAVDADGRVTDLGRRLADVPADPRLARALLDGAELVGARAAAEVVAVLADDHRPEGADLPGLLAALRRGSAPGATRWRDEARRLATLAGRPADAAPDDEGGARGSAGEEGRERRTERSAGAGHPAAGRPAGAEDVGLVVALAHPDRVARRVGDAYLLASGTRAGLPPGALAGHDWLAVADVARADGRVAAGTGAVIRAAAPLTEEAAALAAAGLLIDETRAEVADRRVTARRVRALGAIELSSTPVRPTPESARAAVESALAADGLALFSWSDAADALRRRLAFLHHRVGDPWPDVGDDALAARWPEWLGPEVDALADGRRADRIDLLDPLRRLLPWPEAGRLDELAPERLAVPSGRTARVDYPEIDEADAPPVVAVKLQECFGWARSPRLAGVPVLFHLLSPAGRPLAVTDDLASFWSGPYTQVRAEMRGRYPKHPWPEDPWSATATARTTRRS